MAEAETHSSEAESYANSSSSTSPNSSMQDSVLLGPSSGGVEVKTPAKWRGKRGRETTLASDELGEIIELPPLEGSVDFLESNAELNVADVAAEGWVYPPWWASDGEEFFGYFLDQEGVSLGDCVFPESFG
nr:ethylene-responsive transcription factor TINY-like [Ipomoea trifida]